MIICSVGSLFRTRTFWENYCAWDIIHTGEALATIANLAYLVLLLHSWNMPSFLFFFDCVTTISANEQVADWYYYLPFQFWHMHRQGRAPFFLLGNKEPVVHKVEGKLFSMESFICRHVCQSGICSNTSKQESNSLALCVPIVTCQKLQKWLHFPRSASLPPFSVLLVHLAATAVDRMIF